jgi:homoserine kinase
VTEASAPASSANLGPAFDAVAVALELRCHVSAEPAAAWSVRHVGAECPPPESDDAVLASARLAVGADRPLALTVRNEVPIGKGLGSSSAAFAAGALAAWKAFGESHPSERLYELVARLEGHPDNAAAAVFGGLVLAVGQDVHRLPWNPLLHAVVAVPNRPFPTREARAALPGVYPIDVVVRTVARTSALMAGLLGADPTFLAAAAGDEIHEAPRGRLRPEVQSLISVARSAGAFHACWSGAGPSVLALVSTEAAPRVASALENQLGGDGVVLQPGIAARGAV